MNNTLEENKNTQNLNLEEGKSGNEFGITNQELKKLFEKDNFESGNSLAELERRENNGGILKALKSHQTNGVCSDLKEIELRQTLFGLNSFPPQQMKSFWHFVWLASCDFCIRILTFCAMLLFLVAIFTKSNSDALWQAISLLIAVLAVILIQAITDFRKERQFHELFAHKDEKQYQCFRHLLGSKTGGIVEILEQDVVVGEVVEVSGGNYLEVDGVLITGWVEVDESSLTGKSVTITKRPIGATGISQEEVLGNPFLRSGSSVLNGTGYMLVLCVGSNSLIGKMKSEIAEHDESSLLASSLAELAKFLVKLGSIFACVMFMILMFYSVEEAHENDETLLSANGFKRIINEFIQAFLIIVLSVPQGLPLIMTLGLSFAVANLKKEGVVVRNLNSVTKIGGTDVIIFDKTGTITSNQVQVSRIFVTLDSPIVNVTDHPEKLQTIVSADVRNKLEFFIVNFTSNVHLEANLSEGDKEESQDISELRSMKSVDKKEELSHHNIGNPLDYALENLGQKLKKIKEEKKINEGAISVEESENWSQTEKQETKSTYSTALLKSQVEENKYRIIVQGSIGSLLEKCAFYENPDSPRLSNDLQDKIKQEIVRNFESKSMRVTCIIYKDIVFDKSLNEFKFQDHTSDFKLLVILGLFDEPRAEAKKTIKQTSLAGIKVMMTTGDSKGAALHIAYETGLIHEETEETACMMARDLLAEYGIPNNHGGNYSSVPEDKRETFYIKLKHLKVLYEASAQDKLLIVNAYKAHDHTIGYVGDGNNDSQALSHADVGFSMGKIGTEVAKQSSNIILAHDSLIQIVGFVEWGRNIYYNLERFIYFQITFFSAEVFIMILSSVVLKESPYSVLEIIWLSLIHDIVSAIALSTEKPKKDGERGGKPFKKNQNILNPFLVKIMVVQGLYQTIVLLWILFRVPEIFHIDHSDNFGINQIGTKFQPQHAIHYTMVFHSTALIQITNLINSRRVQPYEFNQFDRILKNKPFIFFIAASYIIQTVIVYFGGSIFKTAPLNFAQNLFCHCIGFGAFISFWLSKLLFSWSEPHPEKQLNHPTPAAVKDEETALVPKEK